MNKERNNSLDLRGVKCPMNYVKTKLMLEKMHAGEVLEVLLDPGEAITSVSASLKEDNYEVMSTEEIGEYFKLVIKASILKP